MSWTLFLDLDGVIADFDGRVAQMVGHFPAEREEVRECMRTPYFFKNLEPLPGALAAVDELERLIPGQLRILSAVPHSDPSLAGVARVEKVAWLEEHLPWLASTALIVGSKAGVGSPESLLVDDHPEWNGAAEFGGEVITFTGPESWGLVTKIVKDRLSTQTDSAKLARLVKDA